MTVSRGESEMVLNVFWIKKQIVNFHIYTSITVYLSILAASIFSVLLLADLININDFPTTNVNVLSFICFVHSWVIPNCFTNKVTTTS